MFATNLKMVWTNAIYEILDDQLGLPKNGFRQVRLLSRSINIKGFTLK